MQSQHGSSQSMGEKFARHAVITASQKSENTHSRAESVNGEW